MASDPVEFTHPQEEICDEHSTISAHRDSNSLTSENKAEAEPDIVDKEGEPLF